ncbi:MAG TPA: cytochrome c-type biogenesis protein CcmH [Xanthomonadaceae bacterium]|nr:cytochrome c-type biogenesis protein CcmH [Xanthomonadaceae bacterium]
MRRLLLAWLLLPALALAAIDPLPFKDREEEARFRNLAEELRCMVCQNQNLADSDAPLAKDLRREVFDLMRQGLSDDEIRTFLVERYSDFVLYRPPIRANTMLLWFGPALVLLVGAVAVTLIVRRRAQALAAQHGVKTSDNDAPDREETW